MSRVKLTIELEVNVDPVSGLFNNPFDFAHTTQSSLAYAIGHYMPVVTLKNVEPAGESLRYNPHAQMHPANIILDAPIRIGHDTYATDGSLLSTLHVKEEDFAGRVSRNDDISKESE